MLMRKGRRPETTLEDITHGFAMMPLWRDMAYEDLVQRYRKTYLGLAWVVIAYVLFVGIIGGLFRRGFSESLSPEEYMTYLATGYWLWTFITSSVGDGSGVISSQAGYVKGAALPISLLFYRLLYRNFMLLGVTVIGLVGFLVYNDALGGVLWLWLIPALPIYCIASFFTIMLLGSVCARLPDVGQAVATTMRLMFFITPIIWVAGEESGLRQILATYNPFAYFLAIVRQPIMGIAPTMQDYVIVLIVTALLAIGGLVSFHLVRPRISLSL